MIKLRQYDNNYYLGTLFKLDKDVATQGVQFAPGDSLTGTDVFFFF